VKATKATSLVLITVDCMRADHTGFMGYPRPTTPFLDNLAGESFVFPNAIVTGAPTYYSLPGLMASRFPLSLGREVVGIAPGEPALATVLQEAGYTTAAFVAANPYLSARFGYEQGFEGFQDFSSQPWNEESAKKNPHHGRHRDHGGLRTRLNQQIATLAHRVGPLGTLYDEAYFQYCQRIASPKGEDWDSLRRFPPADVLVAESRHWLEASARAPFFLWLHFMDPHAPYYPSSRALQEMGESQIKPTRSRYLNESWKRGDIGPERLRKYRDEIVRLYDAGIRWVDMQVSRLADFLRSRSLWDDCMFVVTADHGEEFLDHGGVFHSPAKLHQEMLHVPLLIKVPDARNRRVSAAPFSHVHLAPTLLEAIGIDAPQQFAGRSYWSEVQTGAGWDVAISESVGRCTNPMHPEKRLAGRILAVQDERYKLVLDLANGAEELYDLPNDAQERNCLPKGAETRVRGRMLRTALEHLETSRSQYKTASALRAVLREIALPWDNSSRPAETVAT
jgi:arylsulfatase A-like enzyme